jgi:hypothetical protein
VDDLDPEGLGSDLGTGGAVLAVFARGSANMSTWPLDDDVGGLDHGDCEHAGFEAEVVDRLGGDQ